MASILMDAGKKSERKEEVKKSISSQQYVTDKEQLEAARSVTDVGSLKTAKVVEGNEGCCVSLEDAELWKGFHRLTNEMIVTKNGR